MDNNQTHEHFYRMFIENLQDIYSAEDQYLRALPTLLDKITHKDFKEKLRSQLDEVKKQINRLEKIFTQLNESPRETFCEGMQGLLKECDRMANKDCPPLVKDASLIAALQKVKHYQIATYGSLRCFSKHLDLDEVEDHLQEILDQEWDDDKKLTSIAEGGWFTSGINVKAAR